MTADIEELEEMDASELNAKEVLTPMKGDNFEMPCSRWNSQNLWRRWRLRPFTLTRDRPDRGEEQENLRGGNGHPFQFITDEQPNKKAKERLLFPQEKRKRRQKIMWLF